MQKIKIKIIPLIVITLVLSACGSGGSDNGGDNNLLKLTSPIVDSTGILAHIADTNLGSWGSTTQQHQNYNLKRWDYETTLIPVKHKNESLVIQAMDEIEDKLGYTIFDRTSLTNVTDDAVTRGIIVSIGTANYTNAINGRPAFQSGVCGLASRGIPSNENPDNSHLPYYMYDVNGAINAKIYIHLGSPFKPLNECYNRAVTLHEFAHALGFHSHFKGGFYGNIRYVTLEDGTEAYYDENPNDNFWNVLKNIYNNNINTAKDDLVITRYF
ncbi:hypothetical protein [Candidatus Thiodubiliella endoseptemdiera]|uniref:hypothetical protein n=1 Tax=Candidatus Thiodubiliella endoseptemdiera TaxID=2738886 RepID=UPI0034DEC0BA